MLCASKERSCLPIATIGSVVVGMACVVSCAVACVVACVVAGVATGGCHLQVLSHDTARASGDCGVRTVWLELT